MIDEDHHPASARTASMTNEDVYSYHPEGPNGGAPIASYAGGVGGAFLRPSRGGNCDDISDDGGDNDDDDDVKDKDDWRSKVISLYCLPCISFGIGENGMRRVRALTMIFFPLFLLCLFLLDDLGTIVEKRVRVHLERQRSESINIEVVVPDTDGTTRIRDVPTPRYKKFNEYPGMTREVMWIPMELRARVSVDERTSFDATLRCPRGMMFLFHGCGRYAASFFYSPQGRKIVEYAHARGHTVVAFKKTNELGCWDASTDADPVLYVGRKFMIAKLKDACGTNEDGNPVYPPVYAFGASSGGYFISELASRMGEDPGKYQPFVFAAMNVQIMAPPIDLIWNVPTMFTVMDGDPLTKMNVQKLMASRGAGGSEGGAGEDEGGSTFRLYTTSGRKGIHPSHFYELYRDDKRMSIELSAGIYQDLVDARVIDPTNDDRLTEDPRSMTDAISTVVNKYLTATRTSTKDERLPPPLGLTYQEMRPMKAEELLDADGLWIIEELNVAWDVHEITAEGFAEEVLGFFDEYGRAVA